MRWGGTLGASPSVKVALLRQHYRVPLMEDFKYRMALVRGQQYEVRPLPNVVETYRPPPAAERLSPGDYDPSLDPWEAAI